MNQSTYNYEIKCKVCHASVRVKSLVKLKDRYCCPNCLSTVNINKKEK